MSKTGKILGFGAFGLALLTASKNAQKSKAVKDIAPLAFDTGNSSLDDLISQIKTNGAIRTLLKGEKGDKGDLGLLETSISLNSNYSGSLFGNLAFERNTSENWGDIQFDSTDYKGLKVAKLDSSVNQTADNNSFAFVNPNRLYKISFNVKGTGSSFVKINCFDINKQPVENAGYTYFYTSKTNNTSFENRVLYFGGVSTTFGLFSVLTKYMKVQVVALGGVTYFNELIIEPVGLGEAVPHNLPFLPLNQTVLNNVTGKVGIYNGSTVDYYF